MVVVGLVNDTYKKIGERVKQYRLDRGMSQPELAEGICSRQTISHLENGQHFPSAEFMKKIAAKLGVPIHEIMVDETKELEAKVQLDIIQVYVETGDYANAFPLIEELEACEELLEYQRREIVLCKAECLMRTGQAESAVSCLIQLQQDFEQNREVDSRLIVTVYNKLGNAYFFLSNMPNAYACYQRAYHLCLSFKEFDTLSAMVLYNLATVLKWFGMYSESIDHFKKSYDFFREKSDARRLAQTMFELGLTYKHLGNLSASREFLNQALAIYQSQNMLSMVTRIKEQFAFAVTAVDNPHAAIGELIVCANAYREEGDVICEAYLFARISKLYLENSDITNAGEYITKAVDLISAEMSDPKIPYIYRIYANFLVKINDIENAISFAFISSDIFDRMGLGKETADSLQVVADCFRFLGNKDALIDVLERINKVLRYSYHKPSINLLGEAN